MRDECKMHGLREFKERGSFHVEHSKGIVTIQNNLAVEILLSQCYLPYNLVAELWWGRCALSALLCPPVL